jgi:hypothetical protein
MRLLGYVFVLLLLAGGAAYLTKPSEDDAEALLRDQVMTSVAKEEVGAGRDAAANIALAACKLRPNDCYDLLRSGMDVTYTDKTLWLRVDVEGTERRVTCYGVFGRFFCPGGWKEA